MPQLRALLLTLLILLPTSAQAARLAVLEIRTGASQEVLAELSDSLRIGALEAVRSSEEEIIIMTRESTEMILREQGIDLSCVDDTECAVDIARNLTADYVISATLLELEGTWILSAKLHEAVYGRLLATGQARGNNLPALIDATPAVADSLLSAERLGQVIDRPERLAVLEIVDPDTSPKILTQISDGLRSGALEATRSSEEEIIVITRESMLMILKDQGIDPSCVEGECEVETARNIGADYVISATLVQSEGTYVLSAKLHGVAEGTLLATGRARRPTLLSLIDATPAVAGSLLSQGYQAR